MYLSHEQRGMTRKGRALIIQFIEGQAQDWEIKVLVFRTTIILTRSTHVLLVGRMNLTTLSKVAAAVESTGKPRESLFITTKVPGIGDALQKMKVDLQQLYVLQKKCRNCAAVLLCCCVLLKLKAPARSPTRALSLCVNGVCA